MPWNPETYNQFKNIRYQPFFDLMELIAPENLKKAVDIGCGTGEQTKILSERFENASFLGIDSSAEMLEKSKVYKNDKLDFQKIEIEDWIYKDENWDLIFSNAALQWIDCHEELFPKLISKLSENGEFAVQMPCQKENTLNQILTELASEEPFRSQLKGWNRLSPLLTIDEYTQILFENGLMDLNIFVKVYPIIADNTEKLFQFISGSALIPYLERLNEEEKQNFTTEFKKRIGQKFQKFPAIYSFKRILLYGKK